MWENEEMALAASAAQRSFDKGEAAKHIEGIMGALLVGEHNYYVYEVDRRNSAVDLLAGLLKHGEPRSKMAVLGLIGIKSEKELYQIMRILEFVFCNDYQYGDPDEPCVSDREEDEDKAGTSYMIDKARLEADAKRGVYNPLFSEAGYCLEYQAFIDKIADEIARG